MYVIPFPVCAYAAIHYESLLNHLEERCVQNKIKQAVGLAANIANQPSLAEDCAELGSLALFNIHEIKICLFTSIKFS